MCLNCGCGDYRDKRDHETNITMVDIEKAAQGEGMSVEETIKETIRGLQESLKLVQKKK